MRLYVPIFVLAVLAFGFAAFSITFGAIAGPKRWNKAKLESYECGIEPTPHPLGGGKIPVKYYLTAMLFIVFDIEIIFLYPWAVTFNKLGAFGLIEMVTFVITVLVAYAYVWRRGGLDWDLDMGIEEKLPSGIMLTSVEKLAGWARARSVWPATFGLACCAIELFQTGGPKHDLARFGMERASNTPRQADLMIVAGRLSQKMAPVTRQIYDQMSDPKWVISMGVCASSGGMFNNYAIVQGVDHIIPVDIYLPGCPPRPEMLLDAILKLHDKIMNMKLGKDRDRQITELEEARLNLRPVHLVAPEGSEL